MKELACPFILLVRGCGYPLLNGVCRGNRVLDGRIQRLLNPEQSRQETP